MIEWLKEVEALHTKASPSNIMHVTEWSESPKSNHEHRKPFQLQSLLKSPMQNAKRGEGLVGVSSNSLHLPRLINRTHAIPALGIKRSKRELRTDNLLTWTTKCRRICRIGWLTGLLKIFVLNSLSPRVASHLRFAGFTHSCKWIEDWKVRRRAVLHQEKNLKQA